MYLIETPTTEVEDLLVTFIHRPIKSEPIIYDFNPPQLDGQTDFLSDHNPDERQNLDQVIANIKAEKIDNIPQQSDEPPLKSNVKSKIISSLLTTNEEVVHRRKFSNIFHPIQ
jgi:hypothetical protein